MFPCEEEGCKNSYTNKCSTVNGFGVPCDKRLCMLHSTRIDTTEKYHCKDHYESYMKSMQTNEIIGCIIVLVVAILTFMITTHRIYLGENMHFNYNHPNCPSVTGWHTFLPPANLPVLKCWQPSLIEHFIFGQKDNICEFIKCVYWWPDD